MVTLVSSVDTLPVKASSTSSEAALLLLPESVLERILLATGRKGELRYVCKAFSSAISKSATSIKVPRGILRNRDNLASALVAFPNTRRVVLDLSLHKAQGDCRSTSGEVPEDNDEPALVTGALDILAQLRHPLTSLAVLHLSGALPIPSATTLAYLASCGLTELELQDVSIKRAASDGISNLLRSSSPTLLGQQLGGSLADSIRARGAAMVRFACYVPSLQRLSLCNAAFSASHISSLAALTRLEELSVTGAMECVEALASFPSPQPPSPLSRPRLLSPSATAAVTAYMQLLAALPRLRRLGLPMAVAVLSSGGMGFGLLDSDDDDDFLRDRSGTEAFIAHLDVNNDFIGAHLGQSSRDRIGDSAAREESATGAFSTMGCTEASGTRTWCFPPHLEELTIPLCNLNGPVFQAACTAYGSESGRGSGSDHPYSGGISGRGRASTHQKLRSLQVICAPGYSVWEGSFLNGDRDFAAVARLAPSLECLHLCLELGSSGRNVLRKDRLRSCLGHLKALHRMQELCITETRQPICFAVHKEVGGRPDILSYLLDEDPQLPLPFTDLRLPIMPLLGNQPFPSLPPWGSQSLLAPQATQQPPLPPLRAFCVGLGSSGCASRCLDSLLSHWPQLRTLNVYDQRVARSSRDGQNQLMLLKVAEQLLGLPQQQQLKEL